MTALKKFGLSSFGKNEQSPAAQGQQLAAIAESEAEEDGAKDANAEAEEHTNPDNADNNEIRQSNRHTEKTTVADDQRYEEDFIQNEDGTDKSSTTWDNTLKESKEGYAKGQPPLKGDDNEDKEIISDLKEPSSSPLSTAESVDPDIDKEKRLENVKRFDASAGERRRVLKQRRQGSRRLSETVLTWERRIAEKMQPIMSMKEQESTAPKLRFRTTSVVATKDALISGDNNKQQHQQNLLQTNNEAARASISVEKDSGEQNVSRRRVLSFADGTTDKVSRSLNFSAAVFENLRRVEKAKALVCK